MSQVLRDDLHYLLPFPFIFCLDEPIRQMVEANEREWFPFHTVDFDVNTYIVYRVHILSIELSTDTKKPHNPPCGFFALRGYLIIHENSVVRIMFFEYCLAERVVLDECVLNAGPHSVCRERETSYATE